MFLDRLLATLVHLRHGVTHDVLACWFRVSRSTITRAIGEVRPPLAERGCTIEGGIRLRTLADMIAHWTPPGSSACSMPPRSGCAARPPAGPAGSGSSPAKPAPTPSRLW
ncbi:helix-turn-helix domain-containing protein [Geodermatophilus amargosae]|uniref:helix-turn-helix domain-containing protein n=1 Tax=Geodermatophilus amargosae TaxID=1296565 RepID=UPI000A60AA40|nr:transposase family protein [Geodermatophilus amargosae]